MQLASAIVHLCKVSLLWILILHQKLIFVFSLQQKKRGTDTFDFLEAVEIHIKSTILPKFLDKKKLSTSTLEFDYSDLVWKAETKYPSFSNNVSRQSTVLKTSSFTNSMDVYCETSLKDQKMETSTDLEFAFEPSVWLEEVCLDLPTELV